MYMYVCFSAGDEIDTQYHDEMEEIVQLTGSPESAFAMFHDIVRNLFEWDESGGGILSLNLSKIGVCHHILKNNSSLVVTKKFFSL